MAFTLYVARDKRKASRHDLGSVLCMQTLEFLPQDLVVVQTCTAASSSSYPAWLTGTPTLHAHHSGDVWRGHQALSELQRLAFSRSAPRNASGPPNHTAPSDGHVPSRGRPPHDPHVETDAELEGLWQGGVGEEADEAEDSLPKKLTSDDLARALESRPQPSKRMERDAPPIQAVAD